MMAARGGAPTDSCRGRSCALIAIHVQRLVLDALLPANLHRVLPRLQQLSLLHCRLAPAAADAVLNAACAHLRAIEIRELTAAPTPPAAAGAAGAANHGAAQVRPAKGRTKAHRLGVRDCAALCWANVGAVLSVHARCMQASVGLQLMQLSRLPALQSVHLLDSSCPTLFLTLLGARLTSLHLAPAYRQWVHGTQVNWGWGWRCAKAGVRPPEQRPSVHRAQCASARAGVRARETNAPCCEG